MTGARKDAGGLASAIEAMIMAERLYRLAGSILALALVLYFITGVIRDALPELVGVGIVLFVVLSGSLLVKYRRSRW